MNEIELENRIEAAIKDGDTQAVVALIQEDKSRLNIETVFGGWLHIAAKNGRVEMIERLIDLGLDINVTGGIAGGTALQVGASKGQTGVVKCLLARGALLDISAPEKNPLFGAIHNGHTEIARLLIDAGIDTTVKYKGTSGKKKDALSYARDWGRNDIEELILKSQKE